jgi:dihydroflavonol-4-reductase
MHTPDRNNTVINEQGWTSVKHSDPYSQSKTLAERAAWDHQKECGKTYELSTINPGLIMGTPIVGGSFSSADVAKMFLTGKGPMPALPPMSMAIVDVQDVAEAHYRALMVPEARDRRFVCAYDAPLIPVVAGWVTEKYEPQGYNTMKKTLGAFPMNCLACCVPQARFYMQSYKKEFTVDNSPVKTVLGIDLIDSKTAVLKMCEAQIANGYVPKPGAKQ